MKDCLELITNNYNFLTEDNEQHSLTDLPSLKDHITTFYETKKIKCQKKSKNLGSLQVLFETLTFLCLFFRIY